MNKTFTWVALVGALYGTYWVTDTYWEAKWQAHLAQDDRDRLNYEQKQRDLEHRYAEDREAFELDMQARMADLGTAISDSNQRADGLREQLASVKEQLSRSREAAKLAGVNTGAAEAALVLSDLYQASITELQRVAGTADEWYEQADGCNRFYNEMKEAR